MTMPQKEVIDCPGCGKKQKFTCWRSVNVTLDPDLKQRILDGSLVSFECKACGHKTKVPGRAVVDLPPLLAQYQVAPGAADHRERSSACD